jgi:hypothetical protein
VPDTGRGPGGVFTFHYTDLQGAADIGSAQVDFHEEGRDCNMWITPAGHVELQFYPDRGPALRVSGNAGTLAMLGNPVCSVDLSGASVSANGNDLEIRLAVGFKPAFHGPKEILSWPWDKTGKTRGDSRIKASWVVAPAAM